MLKKVQITAPISATRSRRERERLARRSEILNIARQVFSEKGYYHATLEEIAEKAEFAKGTIYGYFTSKEDLFETLISEELTFMESEIERAITEGSGPVDKLRKLIYNMFNYFTERKEFIRIYLSHIGRLVGQQPTSFQITFTKRHKQMIDHITDFMAESQKEGYFIKVPEVPGAYIFQGIIHAAVLGWLASNQSYELTDMVEPLLDLILHGAGGPKLHTTCEENS